MIGILFFIFITACSKKQPECNSELIKQMVLDIYKEDLQKYLASKEGKIKKASQNLLPINTDSIVSSFLRNGELRIENVMTTEKKEDVFACECRGDLSYTLSVDFVRAFNEKVVLAGKEDLRIDPSLLKIDFETNVIYKVQLTDDKEKIGVEALKTEDLRYAGENFIVWYVANELVGRKVKEGK
ncbi:hypothetical protein [Lacibacter sp. H407]|uniref:hypothetical protein n=1 Tax=Lacibacter sp. H407 TaxID=3133423 RepID=UPI0030BB46C1